MTNRVTHADELPYDNTTSGLSSEDVQAAIDELADGGAATRDGWTLVESASQPDFDAATNAGAILAVYRWGVDGTGAPYFDSAGVTSGEEAALWIDDSGQYVLVELDL